MLDQRGCEKPHVGHALDGTLARGADIVGHADMQVARAIVGGRQHDGRPRIVMMSMPMVPGNAMNVLGLVRTMRMRVIVMRDALATAAVDRDAQHPPRRHAGADLREQEKRQEDACDEILHDARARDLKAIVPNAAPVKASGARTYE